MSAHYRIRGVFRVVNVEGEHEVVLADGIADAVEVWREDHRDEPEPEEVTYLGDVHITPEDAGCIPNDGDDAHDGLYVFSPEHIS